MKRIKEIIVVEGQNDVNKVQSCLEADVVMTHGTHMSQKFINHLKELNKTRGIIVMTDDDYPGRWIRTQIHDALGSCKHAFVDKKVSSTAHKVGIEHASCRDIVKALENVVTLEEFGDTLSFEDFHAYGLSGLEDSSRLRKQLTDQLNLPVMNAKRLYKTLNMMRLTKQDIDQLLEGKR